ncbi:MAG: outer membrane beta-barrel protein [Bacteroidales bacterium]|nr:outer membrane beta-barrel protein [Bacteroidales bacterium]
MKKIIITLAIALVASISMFAQAPKMAVGVDYNYSSKGGNSGIGLQLEYQLFEHLRVSPEFIYSFEKGDHGHFTNVNINLQYTIGTGSGFTVYPLAGFAYVNAAGDVNKCGANVGCGAEYHFSSKFAIYTEETFQMVSHATRFITGVGVKYSF